MTPRRAVRFSVPSPSDCVQANAAFGSWFAQLAATACTAWFPGLTRWQFQRLPARFLGVSRRPGGKQGAGGAGVALLQAEPLHQGEGAHRVGSPVAVKNGGNQLLPKREGSLFFGPGERRGRIRLRPDTNQRGERGQPGGSIGNGLSHSDGGGGVPFRPVGQECVTHGIARGFGRHLFHRLQRGGNLARREGAQKPIPAHGRAPRRVAGRFLHQGEQPLERRRAFHRAGGGVCRSRARVRRRELR
jgi:hypothetical protein